MGRIVASAAILGLLGLCGCGGGVSSYDLAVAYTSGFDTGVMFLLEETRYGTVSLSCETHGGEKIWKKPELSAEYLKGCQDAFAGRKPARPRVEPG